MNRSQRFGQILEFDSTQAGPTFRKTHKVERRRSIREVPNVECRTEFIQEGLVNVELFFGEWCRAMNWLGLGAAVRGE